MAMSKCSSCGNTSFEAVENAPRNSNFKLMFVQCASCGAVVGVMDYYNIGQEMHTVKKALKQIGSKVGLYLDI